jgi:beta-galactosidase/beta-glucuronidase
MKILVILIVLCVCHFALGAEWKRASSPLLTRWAKEVSPDKVLPEYPRPQMVRKDWLSLNGLWDYSTESEKGQILVPFCIESALSGVGKHADKITYRRTFAVPNDWHGKRVLLHFGAVDYECAVSVNGKEVGKHIGGYDAFSFDITDALKKDGAQELSVAVTDLTAETQPRGKQITNPHGIWYTPCTGIWQTVWLEPVIEHPIGEFRIDTDIESGQVNIHARCYQNVKAEILLDGQKVAEGILHAGASPPPIAGGALTIPKDKLKLWSWDSPVLYDLKLRTEDWQGNIDEVSSYLGMRKIEVSPDEKSVPRVKLNGKPITMVGPLDQGFWPDGIYTAPTDEALKWDIEQTKKLGFNCLRKHVKIEPQRFYYWCDKLGIMVWQDMPNTMAKEKGDWQQQFEKELSAMVEQHINSPSIVMWVPLNEGWGQGAYGEEGTRRLVGLVKKLDPSRLVNNASGWTDAGAGDVHDIHSYPGPAAPSVEKQRAIVLGEFGGLGLPIEGHMWETKAW